MDSRLKRMLDKNEKVIYQGKPDKKCFIFEGIFYPSMPFALLWGFMDFFFINAIFSPENSVSGENGFYLLTALLFMIHLFPFWVYLGGVLFVLNKYKNAYYVVTDKAVYLSKGIFSKHYSTTPYTEISNVELHRGFFDKKLDVGDVVLTTDRIEKDSSGRRCYSKVSISDIAYYNDVYKIVKMLQEQLYVGGVPREMYEK